MLRNVYADRCTGCIGGCECGSVSSWFLRCSLAIVKSVGPSTEGSASMHIEVSYCPVKVSSGQFSYGYGSLGECVGILDVASLVLNTVSGVYVFALDVCVFVGVDGISLPSVVVCRRSWSSVVFCFLRSRSSCLLIIFFLSFILAFFLMSFALLCSLVGSRKSHGLSSLSSSSHDASMFVEVCESDSFCCC